MFTMPAKLKWRVDGYTAKTKHARVELAVGRDARNKIKYVHVYNDQTYKTTAAIQESMYNTVTAALVAFPEAVPSSWSAKDKEMNYYIIQRVTCFEVELYSQTPKGKYSGVFSASAKVLSFEAAENFCRSQRQIFTNYSKDFPRLNNKNTDEFGFII